MVYIVCYSLDPIKTHEIHTVASHILHTFHYHSLPLSHTMVSSLYMYDSCIVMSIRHMKSSYPTIFKQQCTIITFQPSSTSISSSSSITSTPSSVSSTSTSFSSSRDGGITRMVLYISSQR